MEDCRNCTQWETCPCGKSGHEKGTSIGYSIGECTEFQDKMDTIMDEYRETILKAIREFEKQFDPVEQYEITDAIGMLYEIIRAIKTG